MNRLSCLLTLSFILISPLVFAQYRTVVKGSIKDIESAQTLEYVNIRVEGTDKGTESDINGNFEIVVNAEKDIKLIFSRVGYKSFEHTVKSFTRGEVRIDVQMATNSSTKEVVISEERMEKDGLVRQNVDELKLLPSVSGNLESLLPSIALGTTSGTGGELSSQYNVRGGNYDENLVYVNEEIHGIP